MLPSQNASPLTNKPNTKCANGAKSPDAPTVPFIGTHDIQFSFNAITNLFNVSIVIPECPFANTFILNANNILVLCNDKYGPIPDACERIKFICKFFNSFLFIITFENKPNPVFTPYTTRFSLITSSITFRASFTWNIAVCVKPIFLKLKPISYNNSGVKLLPSNNIASDDGDDELFGNESDSNGTDNDDESDGDDIENKFHKI